MLELTCEVAANGSQFYLMTGEPPFLSSFKGGIFDSDAGKSLVYFVEPGQLLFTAARQWGDLSVRVRIYEGRPSQLDEGWRDVVELSVPGNAPMRLTGWEPSGDEVALPLPMRDWYRVRYAISNMDNLPVETVTERYLVELWPEAFSDARVVVCASEAGQYFKRARFLDVLRWEIREWPSEVSETTRVGAFADRAFDEFPELAAEMIADGGAGSGLVNDVSFAVPPTSEDLAWMLEATRDQVRERDQATMSRISAQLVEMARARSQ